MRQAPPLPFLPPEWHGQEVLVLADVLHRRSADGRAALAQPLRAFGMPIADVVGPHPVHGVAEGVLDPLLAPGMRNYWKSHDFTALDDGLIDVLVSHARAIPDPQTEIAFAELGGAYVNFLTEEEAGRVKAAYGSNYARLAAIKKQYDPENVFRMNQNIGPA